MNNLLLIQAIAVAISSIMVVTPQSVLNVQINKCPMYRVPIDEKL